jgi:hypothetical protein
MPWNNMSRRGFVKTAVMAAAGENFYFGVNPWPQSPSISRLDSSSIP